jgi:site-specific recombinase XerC
MNSGTGLIAPLVQSFFTDHLVRQRRASPQTVASYRDTFRLLIQHLSQTIGRKPSDLKGLPQNNIYYLRRDQPVCGRSE